MRSRDTEAEVVANVAADLPPVPAGCKQLLRRLPENGSIYNTRGLLCGVVLTDLADNDATTFPLSTRRAKRAFPRGRRGICLAN